jgi:hypothetical protein
MPADQDRKATFLAFWTTLPGILTGLAALVSAVVGGIALWKTQSGGGDNSPTAAPRTVTLSSAPTVGAGGQSKISPFLASGRLSLFRGDSADLERGKIGESTEADLSFGPESTPTLRAAATASLAAVNRRPTKPACVAALRRRGDSFEVVSQVETKWTCVSTTDGNVGVMRILKVVASVEVVLDYVVWR